MITGGIGLRSVIDISLYVEYHLNDLDLNIVNTLLKETNSITFFQQLILFTDSYLDKDLTKKLAIKEEFNNELFETFTQYIVQSGIHGLGMSFNNYIGKLANDQNKGLSKKGSFMKQVFLPYSSMKYMYPRLLKTKILLPLAWILRIFRVTFRHTKRFLIRLKLYKVDQKTIDEASLLFHQMGI